MAFISDIFCGKDWPPTADFKDVFRDLFEDFMAMVPMQEYIRADGSMNGASHFNKNLKGPDLGKSK
jgi:lysine-specific demethylase 3